MNAPVTYRKNFVENPTRTFERLRDELAWVRVGGTPRSEYYCNDVPVPYTYGSGRGVRTYEPQPWHEEVRRIQKALEELTGTRFEVCFLNRYHDQRDHLGWHADDSPEMDDARPIAIVSLGVERNIQFLPRPGDAGNENAETLLLQHGSLALMAAGMQDTHFHRVPKAGFHCGERISLTFRGYVTP